MLKKKFKYMLLAIPAILFIVLNYKIYALNILPLKYCLIISIICLIIDIILDVTMLIRKKKLNFISFIFIVLITNICIIGIYYVNHTQKFLDKNFGNNEDSYQLTYYIASKTEYQAQELNDKDVAYYINTPNIDEALENYNKAYSSNMVSVDDIDSLISSDIFLIESATYQILFEDSSDANYYIIYEFTLSFSLDFEENQETEEIETEDGKKLVKDSDAYNIYIGAYDFSNVRMDLNVVVTLNMRTHKLFITNIPRDYYLTIPSKNKKDTLSTMSPYGINNNISAIENMLNIKIDYYLTTKTPGFVKFIDAIDGITYCSSTSFTTSHALVLGTYDDTLGEHLEIKEGCQHLNGIETLTLARERMAFSTQDIARQENNAAIMQDILEKMKSPTIIVKYTSILDAVGEMYTTNIPKNLIQKGVKTILEDNWQISNQVLVGVTSYGTCELSGTYKYVMHPNQASINSAKAAINKIQYKEAD